MLETMNTIHSETKQFIYITYSCHCYHWRIILQLSLHSTDCLSFSIQLHFTAIAVFGSSSMVLPSELVWYIFCNWALSSPVTSPVFFFLFSSLNIPCYMVPSLNFSPWTLSTGTSSTIKMPSSPMVFLHFYSLSTHLVSLILKIFKK